MKIDPHCHTFNASDLSVRGFITMVLLDMDEREWPIKDREKCARWLLDLVDNAPRAQEEIEYLDNRVGVLEGRFDQISPEQEREFIDKLSASLVRLAMLERDGDNELRDAIFAEIKDARGLAASDITVNPEASALALLKSKGAFGTLVTFVKWMKCYRHQITQRLIDFYGEDEDGGVRLFTPALVDFANWVKDRPDSEPIWQNAVHERLIREFPGQVHPFVAYDPWRQAEAPSAKDSALEVVKRAVGEQGFIGVKVYPPMGFRVWSNELGEQQGEIKDLPEGLAPKLDNAMGALFDWAVAQDVPVMAHCNASNETLRGRSERAHPKYWRRALETLDHRGERKYKNLRVNLGHFGGFADPEIPQWYPEIIELMKEFPNVYADVGHFGAILEGSVGEELLDKLANLVKNPANEVVRKRLMFATDWSMIARLPGSEEYLRLFIMGIKARFSESTPFITDFFGGNAARYLGLAPACGTWNRLNAYYDNPEKGLVGKKPEWLKVPVFDT